MIIALLNAKNNYKKKYKKNCHSKTSWKFVKLLIEPKVINVIFFLVISVNFFCLTYLSNLFCALKVIQKLQKKY